MISSGLRPSPATPPIVPRIPEIDLIGKYNPNDLEGNAYQFDKALNEWGKLYDKFNKKIEKVDSVEELMEK